MIKIVVDANVVAKWFLKEEYNKEAKYLRDLYIDRKISLIAPIHLVAEVCNAIWKAFKIGKVITYETALLLLREFPKLYPILICPDSSILSSAFEISEEFGITIYDSLYIALLKLHFGELFVTADIKLYDKIKDMKGVIYLPNIMIELNKYIK